MTGITWTIATFASSGMATMFVTFVSLFSALSIVGDVGGDGVEVVEGGRVGVHGSSWRVERSVKGSSNNYQPQIM